MSENKIKVTATTSTKPVRVSVSTPATQGNVTFSQDTSAYNANIAQQWAVSENLVLGQDYSSKYYANKAKESATNANNTFNSIRDTYQDFQEETSNAFNELNVSKAEVLGEIDIAKTNAVDSINTTKTTIITDIEFVADGEKDEIKDLADLIKENAQDIASRTSFAMFDTVLKDHVLTYEESKGLALQGTYVYKNAVAGERYGYPDFYEKCLEEYNESIGERWVQPVLTANGVLGGNTFAVSADGERSDSPVYKMFDNDSSTYWYGTTNGKGYVTLYNPTPLNIVNLKITNSQWVEDNIATGEILVSNNGIDWAKILTFTGNTAANATWEIDLNANGGFYKYYKINILSLGSTSYPPAIVNLEIITGKLVKNANGHLFYDIADKDIIDLIFESTGMAWMYGIDQENERIFLPRNNWFEQITGDVSEVGQSVEAGLPNHTHILQFGSDTGSGGSSGTGWNQSGVANYIAKFTTDEVADSSIYGKSDTVQPPAVKKLLYICVGNTETVSSVTDVVEVTTSENDTTPLFTGMYFDFTPNNVSWLKAGQQANSGGVYTTCYNELVNVLNGETKYGDLKVIDVVDMIAGVDYSEYWKVNQDDMTFTTPTAISNKALSGAVVGNGISLGITNGTNDYALTNTINSGTSRINGGVAGSLVGSTSNIIGINVVESTFGITSDPTKSGIIAEESTAQLYFKVANAVQNLELLNAGEVLEAVADVVPNNSSIIASYAMPSNRYIDLTLGASGTTYTAPANGYFMLNKVTTSTNQHIYMFNVITKMQSSSWANIQGYGLKVFLPCRKNDVIQIDYTAAGLIEEFRFIYAEGEI